MLRFTITVSICALLLCALSCTKSPESAVQESYSLVQDFRLSERPGELPNSKKSFATAFVTIGEKRVPGLVQKRPGEVHYFYKLGKNPILRLSTYFAAKTSKLSKAKMPKIDARVIVESEDGKVERHDVSESKVPFRIDLNRFQQQIVQITLSSTAPQKKGIYKKFFWIDPVIVQDAATEQPAVLAEKVENIRARHKGQNVLIVLFDAANPAHFRCYGYHRDTSPNVDSLAAEGVLFQNAMAQAAHTLASTGVLFTGLYPEGHGVMWRPRTLDLRYKTMAEAFTEAGYRTFMGSCNPNASPVMGYGQGFQDIWSPRMGKLLVAPQLVQHFSDWLNRNHSQEKPFFAYLHFREPHKPYAPPDVYRRRFEPDQAQPLPNFLFPTTFPAQLRPRAEAAYDANIAFVDAQFGRIVRQLKEMGLWDRTIIVILADHGEGFWEHGKQGHNLPVYEEIIRIPMIIRLPGEDDLKAARRKEPVGSIDIYPTMADLFGFSGRGIRLQGQSLLPLLTREPRFKDRVLMSQAVRKCMFTIRSNNFKYILDYRFGEPRGELYDLERDPQERHDLSTQRPILASYLRNRIMRTRREANMQKTILAPGRVGEIKLDEQTIEELRALGYVGNN